MKNLYVRGGAGVIGPHFVGTNPPNECKLNYMSTIRSIINAARSRCLLTCLAFEPRPVINLVQVNKFVFLSTQQSLLKLVSEKI